eukprot:12549386-Alexandrium_andersonii.AAC.1
MAPHLSRPAGGSRARLGPRGAGGALLGAPLGAIAADRSAAHAGAVGLHGRLGAPLQGSVG